MDSLIRFIGSNYKLIDSFGNFVMLLCLLLLVILYRYLYRRRLKRWAKLISGLFLTIPFIVICAIILFAKSYIADIQVPQGYKKEFVTIQSGKFKLKGELLFPEHKQNVPALVFVVGSDVSSYNTNYARLSNEVVTKVFSEAGYAILYYNKRGIGGSSGDWTACSFEDLAADAYAAVEYLKTLPQINKSKIIIAGHSQGGWIAQLAASQHSDIFSLLSLAGPVTGVKEQSIDDERNKLICEGLDSATAAVKANELMAEVEARSRTTVSGRYYHFKKIMDYYPDTALKKIKQPALFLFASNDRLVMADKNISRMKKIFNDSIPANFQITNIPGAGHSFRTMEFCFSGSQKKLGYSIFFINTIKEWISGK